MGQRLKIGSLCSGYGGLDMAVEAYFGAETVWMCDYDKYASIAIKERWNKPNLGDLTKVDWSTVEPIDILTAGYPCQPFSHAGQRKGINDARHIWPYIAQAISVLRPKYVILENVRGHLSLGFKEVLKDLAERGYDARWRIVRASDVGAPHQRARLFIVAYPNGQRSQRWNKALLPEWEINQRHSSQGSTTNANCDTRFAMHLREVPDPLVEGKLNTKFVEYMMGLPEGWVTDLPISRAQQFKMLGNGVVPQQAHYALSQLL